MWNCIALGCALILQFQFCFSLENYSKNQLSFSPRDGGHGWGASSSGLFDIALTALAFLSFGIFLLNLLCNALMYPSLGSTPLTNPGPILTMVTGGNGGGGGGTTGGPIITGGTGLGGLTIRRRRPGRSVFSPTLDLETSEEFLINFVSNSIDAMARKHECLPKILCEANRQSKLMNAVYKFLVPAISISISCTGHLLRLYDDLPTHLNAIRLGSQEVSCQSYFPNCD